MFLVIVWTLTNHNFNDFAPLSRNQNHIFRCHTVTNGTNLRRSSLVQSSFRNSCDVLHLFVRQPALATNQQCYQCIFRLGICRDRRDRRSCKIFVSCVNFSIKQRSFLNILQVYAHLNVNFFHSCLRIYTFCSILTKRGPNH